MSAFEEFVSKVKARFVLEVPSLGGIRQDGSSAVTLRAMMQLLDNACDSVALETDLSFRVVAENRDLMFTADLSHKSPETLADAIRISVAGMVRETLVDYCHEMYLDLRFAGVKFDDIKYDVLKFVSEGLDIAENEQRRIEAVSQRGEEQDPLAERALNGFREKLSAVHGAIILLEEDGFDRETSSNLKTLVSDVGGKMNAYSKDSAHWELAERTYASCDFLSERGPELIEQNVPSAVPGR